MPMPADELFVSLDDLERQYAKLLSALDAEHVLGRTAEMVRSVSGADVGVVGRFEDDAIINRFVVGRRTDGMRDLLLPRGVGLGGKVLACQGLVSVNDYAAAPGITHEFDAVMRAEGLRAVVAVPIFAGEEMVGVLYGCGRQPNQFGDIARTAIWSLAGRAGTAVCVAGHAQRMADVQVADERTRAATELHDSVGQMLFSISAIARDLRQDLGADPMLRQRVDDIASRASDAAATLREAVLNLSLVPDDVAFATELRASVTTFGQGSGIDTKLILLGDVPAMSPATAATLLRCVREALHNVHKHACAELVVVSCYAATGGVTLVVQDDGVGVSDRDPDGRAGTNDGFGIAAMRTRIERMNGRLSIHDSEDGGCTIRIWVPC
jgi:signal transduction histidine kinase